MEKNSATNIWNTKTLFEYLGKDFKKNKYNLCELRQRLDDVIFSGCSSSDDGLSSADKARILCDAYARRPHNYMDVMTIITTAIAGLSVMAAIVQAIPDAISAVMVLICLLLIFVVLIAEFIIASRRNKRETCLFEALMILGYEKTKHSNGQTININQQQSAQSQAQQQQ